MRNIRPANQQYKMSPFYSPNDFYFTLFPICRRNDKYNIWSMEAGILLSPLSQKKASYFPPKTLNYILDQGSLGRDAFLFSTRLNCSRFFWNLFKFSKTTTLFLKSTSFSILLHMYFQTWKGLLAEFRTRNKSEFKSVHVYEYWEVHCIIRHCLQMPYFLNSL